MFLITGSTGNIGRPLVDQLHEEGHDVRALVRSASRAKLLPDGIEVAVGDLDDAESIERALRGVDSVFVLHAGAGTTQTQNVIDAARSTGVNRVVLLSSIGARLMPRPIIGETLAAREDLLVESGLDVTYLRPNGIMSNALWEPSATGASATSTSSAWTRRASLRSLGSSSGTYPRPDWQPAGPAASLPLRTARQEPRRAAGAEAREEAAQAHGPRGFLGEAARARREGPGGRASEYAENASKGGAGASSSGW